MKSGKLNCIMHTSDIAIANIAGILYNYGDLINFINNVSINKDTTIEKRKELIKRYHKYADGKSSERVVDIIEKTMKE